MRVSWNVEELKKLSDKELSRIFNEKSVPSLELVYLRIGRELPKKEEVKKK